MFSDAKKKFLDLETNQFFSDFFYCQNIFFNCTDSEIKILVAKKKMFWHHIKREFYYASEINYVLILYNDLLRSEHTKLGTNWYFQCKIRKLSQNNDLMLFSPALSDEFHSKFESVSLWIGENSLNFSLWSTTGKNQWYYID